MGRICGWLLCSIRVWGGYVWQQTLLQSSQPGAQGCAEEAIVAHFHETARQDMLKKALDEMLHGETTGLDLACVGGAVLESDLRSLQIVAMIDRDQTPVADGNTVDVGGQVFEGSLPVSHWFAMDNPFSPPDFWRDLCVDGRSSQGALEGSAEQFGEGFYRQEKVFASRQPDLPIPP